MKDIKEGDIVHVRQVVYDVGGQFLKHRPLNEMCTTIDDVVHVEPRPIKVGDRVIDHTFDKSLNSSPKGTIIAVHDAHAWVNWDQDRLCTEPLSDLTRIDGDAPGERKEVG